MKHSMTFRIQFPAIISIVLFIVGCTPTPMAMGSPEMPTQTSISLEITSTPTEIPPSSTPTPEPTFTPTSTKTWTLTPIPTKTRTFTPQPAILTFIKDSVCMTGASYGHKVDHYVNEGATYPLIGQLLDHSWWMVETEDGGSCWVNADVASIQGDVGTLSVMTPPPIPSETPTATPEVRGIYYMLLAVDTGGPFGCGDDLIKYFPGVWVKGGLEDDILGALNALFANHNKYVNGLYNPMYQSVLKAKSVEIVGKDVVVQLGGTLVRPKDACESKQMHDQVWYTVRQFSSVRPVIYLNKALLGDLLVVSK